MSLTILRKQSSKEISQRKLETYDKYLKVITWGRNNPIPFIERFMGVSLLDIQSYAIANSWNRDFILWLESRNAGKSAQLGIYTMAKSLLFPLHATYFLGNTGEQAKDTFKKIEKLAKKEIESFAGSTDVFFEELKKNANSDGFVHSPASFTCELFNGSTINTLNSDITNIKGKRANLVCFDEAGWFSDELFIQAENFVNQSENFKLGGEVDLNTEPKGFPRQLLYASSASDTSSEFYKKFKSFSKEMLKGNQHYFVCNFTVDSVMKAKYKGEPYPPLISQDKVDNAMADNREKALRELYNQFSADSYDEQILSRRDLRQCTTNRLPLLENDTGNKLFVMAWDSARLNDNSVIGIAELKYDDNKGWCMELGNIVSLVDISTHDKTPMRMPEQVEKFKHLLLKYNGNDKMKLDYENIKAVICDSGAGGNMIGGVTDYLLANWKDEHGVEHKGLIDRSHKSSETAKIKYPNAADIIKLVDPKGNRNAIFESLEQMVKLGVFTFPTEYDTSKEYVFTIDDNGNEQKTDLNFDQKLSLAQIELAKTEIVTMCKYVNGGNVRYDYPPEKRSKMHDDKLYVVSLLCYYLAQLRRNTTITKPKEEAINFDWLSLARRPSIVGALR